MMGNAVEKPQLQQSHPHDRQRLRLDAAEVAAAKAFKLIIEPRAPCDSAEDATGCGAAVGERKRRESRPEHRIGIAAAMLDRHENFDRRLPRRETGRGAAGPIAM